MRTCIVGILVVIFTSCETGRENDGQISPEKQTVKKLDNAEVPEEYLVLENENLNGGSKGTLNGNLFGRFFCDRAEFFVIDNPQNEIYSKTPKSIILYYLDGSLCQSKYEFNEDVAERLYKELGSCRIVGRDKKNKEIIESREIRIPSELGTKFNPKLDNYEIRWTIGDKQVKYRVETIKNMKKYIYTERLKSYESLYNQIEKYC